MSVEKETMINIFRSLIGTAGMLIPQLHMFPGMSNSPCPSLPAGHPACTQFSAWLTAFNTIDRDTLLSYHTDSTFPYSVASRDISSPDLELSLAYFTGGFNVAEIDSRSEPFSVIATLREKNNPSYARVTMLVDVYRPNYPATKFNIHPIITPIKFIPKDSPRRGEYEKALKPLTPTRRGAVVEAIMSVVREQDVYPELGEELIADLKGKLEKGE